MSEEPTARRRATRSWILPWLGYLLLWTMLAAGLISLHDYIYAPLPPGTSPDQMPEGEGEGIAMLFFFFPGLLVLAALTVLPLVVAAQFVIRKSRSGRLIG